MDITFVIILILSFILSLIGAYFLLAYTYGDKNPKKWKPILFSKNDTFENTFFPNKGKGKESDLNVEK